MAKTSPRGPATDASIDVAANASACRPADSTTALGVGYEPALNLMPLLTLDPRAALIDDPEHGRANCFTVSLDGLDGVAHAAQQIVHFVHEHASAAARDFPDAAAIDAQLQREIDSALTRSDAEREDEENDPGASDSDTQLRLVVLAAMGRHEDARALARRRSPGRSARRRHPRSAARRPRPPRPSWSDARAESKAKKEALDAARAMSKGKSLDQLKDLITTECEARGIEIAPSVVNLHAEMLQVQQQPFGRARTALKAIRMLKSSGGNMIRLIKHASDDDPEWLQPPDRAAYPMIADRRRYTSSNWTPRHVTGSTASEPAHHNA